MQRTISSPKLVTRPYDRLWDLDLGTFNGFNVALRSHPALPAASKSLPNLRSRPIITESVSHAGLLVVHGQLSRPMGA